MSNQFEFDGDNYPELLTWVQEHGAFAQRVPPSAKPDVLAVVMNANQTIFLRAGDKLTARTPAAGEVLFPGPWVFDVSQAVVSP